MPSNALSQTHVDALAIQAQRDREFLDNAKVKQDVLGVLDRPQEVDTSAENILVPLYQPPATLLANQPVTLEWLQPIRHLTLQNNTTGILYIEFELTAGVGSYQLAAGATLSEDLHLQTISLLSGTGAALNNPATAGVWLRGIR